ncbi:hypothetical protein JY651_07035 [Pyxidicoccus parkwayensis]|uniref:EGF-like domain-containing protein n=1 Tax=Pyxidicoccus parkwayensis TaxID=2813578 RepID=A0ABX7P1E6_9BACT|nr:hypothetical protein [Pyxidicoccus parkwaysis]QSQ24696.1 hypothetical protein JY651_07035 [Pyxidicoccus parkwaysis]
MNGRNLALAVIPSIALFLGALAPTSAEAACSCNVTCNNGSSCKASSADGNSCSCSCNWFSGNARCRGDTVIGITKQQMKEILRLDKAIAMSDRVGAALGGTSTARLIQGAIYDASAAMEKDEKAFEEAVDALDEAVLTLSAEDQKKVQEIALSLVSE